MNQTIINMHQNKQFEKNETNESREPEQERILETNVLFRL